MTTLLFALLSLPVSLSTAAVAAEKPAHTATYSCATPGTQAEVLDAFDANMQRLYTSATVKSGSFEFAGFVTSESMLRGEVVFVTWTGAGFRLVGRFTPSLPSRNFTATLYVDGRGEQVELGCTF